LVTEKLTAFDTPPGVVTVTVRAPTVANLEISRVTAAVLGMTPVFTLLTTGTTPSTQLRMLQVTCTVIPLAVKLIPCSVTLIELPSIVCERVPLVGLIEIKVGAGGGDTLKDTAPVVPPEVVTVTLR